MDEEALLELLRDHETPKTPDQVRWLCNMVLFAAHDRRVTNEFFIEVVNTVSSVQAVLAELISAGRMTRLMGQLDPERENVKLDAEIEKLVKDLLAQRRKLTKQMDLISQCPTAEDTVS